MTYLPSFVTETDERFWTDCTWASATMFVDSWTLGQHRPDREALRAASGDTVGGSNLDDVARGLNNLIPSLPSLYRPTTWAATGAVNYLKSGGVLIAQGLYSSIRSYTTGRYVRWDPSFATQGSKSGHAVCVAAYRVSNGQEQVYWMDPLGRGTYKGEWMPASIFKVFLNSLRRSNGSVRVAAAKVGAAALLPDTSTGETMSIYTRIAQGGSFVIPADKTVRAWKPGRSGWDVAKTWANHSRATGSFRAHLHRASGTTTPSVLLECTSGFFEGFYVSTADVIETIVVPADTSPFTQADMDAAIVKAKADQNAALLAAQAQVNTLKAQLATVNAVVSALRAQLAAALQKAKDIVTSLTP